MRLTGSLHGLVRKRDLPVVSPARQRVIDEGEDDSWTSLRDFVVNVDADVDIYPSMPGIRDASLFQSNLGWNRFMR